LSDDELGASDMSVKRIKSMSFENRVLILQQAGTKEQVEVEWDDVILLVTGRLFVKRVEIQERKTRRSENEIVQSSEFSVDNAVIDFYDSSNSQTWRVNANGFDFSCLGPKKTLIANENITRLLDLLISNSPNARIDGSYRELRRLLDLIWGSQPETQSSGWRRDGPGRLSVGVASTNSNEGQFTRYSRMQRYFQIHSSARMDNADG
jgi:hypothetical protein